ncbi:PspA/IM30 family protein [Solimonas marina]|uniref:Phage shock protein PspA n=1 Tax=Solimonas marina TaxID=2714601 RepID=A0A969WBD3_9GAMM|nr:PspA/IM30 family protein [Solimonas marina]NKF23428.1 phage shock protein PspA [Solimonas marina]
MGIFSRTRDVIDSNLSALLNKAEDPEKMARLIIQEMEDTLVEVRSTAVRFLARKKELQRAIETLGAEAEDWETKAELAVRKDRDDLARGALAAKRRASDRIDEAQRELKQVELEVGKLDEDIAKLRAKLSEARQRQKNINLRSQSASSRIKLREQMDDKRSATTQAALDDAERAADELESRVDAYELGADRLRDEFARLADDKIEDELARLRARAGKNNAQE